VIIVNLQVITIGLSDKALYGIAKPAWFERKAGMREPKIPSDATWRKFLLENKSMTKEARYQLVCEVIREICRDALQPEPKPGDDFFISELFKRTFIRPFSPHEYEQYMEYLNQNINASLNGEVPPESPLTIERIDQSVFSTSMLWAEIVAYWFASGDTWGGTLRMAEIAAKKAKSFAEEGYRAEFRLIYREVPGHPRGAIDQLTTPALMSKD